MGLGFGGPRGPVAVRSGQHFVYSCCRAVDQCFRLVNIEHSSSSKNKKKIKSDGLLRFALRPSRLREHLALRRSDEPPPAPADSLTALLLLLLVESCQEALHCPGPPLPVIIEVISQLFSTIDTYS